MSNKLGITLVTIVAAIMFAFGTFYCAAVDKPQTHHRVIFMAIDDTMVQTLSDDLKAEIDREIQREWSLEVQIDRTSGELPHITYDIIDVS